MTEDRMALTEAIQKADDGNFLRPLAATVLQIIMDADVEALVGAGRHERSDGRLTYGKPPDPNSTASRMTDGHLRACNFHHLDGRDPSWGGRCSNPGENNRPGSDITWCPPGELAQPPAIREQCPIKSESG